MSEFIHLDTHDLSQPIRGRRSQHILVDDYSPDILTDDYVLADIKTWWNNEGKYKFKIEDGKITMVYETPDFGEFSPSQELNCFINALK